MVYCGKPSRGCQMCRTRRIKCDEGKPTCAQCAKSRRQCPGYKDDFDLVFRNETLATEKRAKKSSAKAKRASAAAASQSIIPFQRRPSEVVDIQRTFDFQYEAGFIPERVVIQAPQWVPAMPALPIDQIATHFFFSNFVTVPYNNDSRGFLDYMIPLVNTHSSNRTLNLAFSAASLAALANRPNAKQLLPRAEEQYMRAIRHVNAALRDPVEQTADHTLASVLLLGLFESIMSRKVSMTAWGSHIDGAVQIIKMRGRNQLRTPVGNALFNAVRTQMIVNALATGKSPEWPVEDWMADSVGRDENADEVNRLALRLAELRCDLNKYMTLVSRTPENVEKVMEVVRRIREIQKGFDGWEAQLPEVWRPRTVAWVDAVPGHLAESEVFPGKIDVFADIWIASIWNLVRVSKLFISGAIIRSSAWLHAPGDYRTTPEYASAARLGVNVVSDLISSVPYYLGWTASKEFNTQFGLASGDGFLCGGENVAPRSLGAFVAIWPVFSCYSSDFATDAQRMWSKCRLAYITDVMGMNQAKTLSGYQLRLPSMTVKRDQFGVAMMLAAQQAAAASAAAANSAASAAVAVPASTSSLPTRTPGLSTSSPPYPTSTLPPAGTYLPPSATSGYAPTASIPQHMPQMAIQYGPSNVSHSTYSQSNASACYPPSTASDVSTSPMPQTPQQKSPVAPPITGVSPQMQLQFMTFMKQDATPDVELQAAFDEAERKQRAAWKRELERQREQDAAEEAERRKCEERERARMMEREERRRELGRKKEELITQATGGDSRMAELIERYMAVKMFDDI